MQIRRWFVGAIVGALVVLGLGPSLAQAAGPPEIISVTPETCNPGSRIIIRGANFEAITQVVVCGATATKIITTGTPTKGQCKLKSPSELECVVASEAGTCVKIVTEFGTAGKCFARRPNIYKNGIRIGTARTPSIGYGQIQLESPQIQTTVECVNIGLGAGWNIADETGGGVYGHGQILVWWASGHTPNAEHTELSSRCRFIYHGGTGEGGTTSGAAWASAEPPLKLINQEGIVCAEPSKKGLTDCPSEVEQIHETVTREVSREAPSLPWNVELTERAGGVRAVIGLPEECKQSGETELIVPTECPEPSEQRLGPPERCNIPPTPDHPGCVKVQILSNPPLNVHMEYEGYVEPLVANGGPNGLSPSAFEFEGHQKGEPALHLRETPTTEGSLTGSSKLLGYSAQELITAR